MKTIEILMVAASRVGKTSLLAAMYEHIKPAFDETDCYIEPIDETVHELQERRTELCEMFEPSHSLEFKGGGIGASISRREYRFRIGRKGRNPDLEIAFIDLPGGYYTTKDPQKREEIDQQIRQSFATLLPIDVAALFEGNGSYHQKVNQPVHISTLYERVFKDFGKDERKLVILTPIKCEKYVQQPNGKEEIFHKLIQEREYKSLFALFKSQALKEQINLAVCPVQTVGGIHVLRTETDNSGNPEHILHRVGSYTPKNCQLPLLYLFFSILQMAKEQKSQNPVVKFFRDLFKMDKHLEQALEKMVKELMDARRKQEIKIVQGPLQNCNVIG